MAACAPLSTPVHDLSVSTMSTGAGPSVFAKAAFLTRSHKLLLPSALPPPSRRRGRAAWRCRASAGGFDYIPKQFREVNLKEGLNENFKNVPKHFYGLSESQMDTLMAENGIASRQAQKVTEESISSAWNYLHNGGMWSLSRMKEGPSRYSMSASMYRGGAHRRPRAGPPDLPSLLLDARICYLGMPILPAVTELIVAQLMWLEFDSPTKPIYLYINSSGTQDENREIIGSETDAYAIADAMAYCKPKVYTVNCGMAFGQAAMLLSLGAKGFRALQPHASTKLYLPKVNKSSGVATDMWIRGTELDVSTDTCINFLAKGIGKPREEIAKDIRHPRYLDAQEAIAYGVADKIIDSRDSAFEKRVKQTLEGIFINQVKYTVELLKKYGMAEVKSISTPMATTTKLYKDENGTTVDATLFRGMIGSLLYLTACRPDIQFTVCLCARFQSCPKESHLMVVKRIFRYLIGTIDFGL